MQQEAGEKQAKRSKMAHNDEAEGRETSGDAHRNDRFKVAHCAGESISGNAATKNLKHTFVKSELV